MDAFLLIGKGALAVSLGGLLVLVASFLLGYIIIGKLLNPDIRLRWAILILVFVFFCSFSVSPSWLAGLYTKDFQHLRFELIVRMIPIGLSIGQMFGGSKIKLTKKKKDGNEEEEENGESS
ncbi:MAG: hypothetical protein ABIJ82_02525 [Patescibacteria group bacterium]|nr:hypothetical protein [Patescibacteria group bacterium]MBU1953300.1 hypothetical protein [Patescibacteria group bacterium]